MSNKIMEFTKGNGRAALMQEPTVFECTPQLEAILSMAKQWEIMVVFNEPLVCGGIEQIKCVFHPAGYEAVLNHEPGVIKIYEMNTFVDAAALDFERLVLTMMDIWKQTRREEPQTPKNYRVTPETTPELQEAIKNKQGTEVGLVESAFFAGFEAASKEATPPAAANTPKNDCAICATFFGEGEDVWDEVLAAGEQTTQNQIKSFETDIYKTIPLPLENELRWSMSLVEANDPELGLEIASRLLNMQEKTGITVGSVIKHQTKGGIAFRVLVPTLPRFPWAYAPKWARFAVKTSGGSHLWLECPPEKESDWITQFGIVQPIPREFCRVDCNWDESLEANPYYFGFMIEEGGE